jgi:hypothetical protein
MTQRRQPKKLFTYFRLRVSKYENLKPLLQTETERKKTRQRHRTMTEERKALMLRIL